MQVHSIGFGTTSGASTSIVTNATVFNHVVAAATNDYFMLFVMSVNAASTTLRFFGCAMTYTMPGPAY